MQIFMQTLKLQVDKSSDVYNATTKALMVAVIPTPLSILSI